MKSYIVGMMHSLARRSIEKRCQLTVGEGSTVLFRQLRHRPPARLQIGKGSIVQAQILSDREGSTVVIGDNTFIGGSQIVCAKRIEIGDDVLISWGCTIVDHGSHSLFWEERKNDVADTRAGTKDWSRVSIEPVTIKNRAWLGFNVCILPGVTIGEGAVVGAASVVTKDVAPYSIVAGNPARFIRHIPQQAPAGLRAGVSESGLAAVERTST